MGVSDKGMMQVKGLAVGYGNGSVPLHSNIDIEVNEGEFICLLGPNGAGKSTLIKTLAGFLKPIQGDVFFNGCSLKQLSESDRSKLVSVVLTDRLQVPNLTVFELVALGRTPYTGFFGKLTPEDVELVNNAISRVGLANYRHKPIDKMSDGERQKAMIAKALVQETPFIILDEPTAFLDLPAKLEIMQLLKRLSCEHGRGILLSTHDLEMALQIADKIWLLAQGRKLQVGIPEDLVLSNDFKSFFEREGVVFDNHSGSFKYHKISHKPVCVKGTGVECQWIERALYRVGYKPVKTECDYSVAVDTDNAHSYSLFKKNTLLLSGNKIEDVLNRLALEYCQ